MTERLLAALRAVVSLRSPSIADTLRNAGFRYEADRMDELVNAWSEYEQALRPEPPA